MLRRTRPAILLQDVYMPELDLDALMRQIRADRDIARTPVILFTASVEADDVVERVGADGMLRKPFDLEALEQAIHGVLAHPHAL